MMETAWPAVRPLSWLGCVSRTQGAEHKIDSTATPYRAPSLLSETVARSCTELILKECEIEELPELIGMYYLLRELDVSENKLVELPPDVGSCWSLQLLDFSSNQIRIIPDEISQLPYLRTLKCHNNKITELPEWVGEMDLIEVNCFNNKILKVPETMGQLVTATSLNLANNVCMQLSDEMMAGWGALKTLNLYDCRLVKIGGFSHFLNLESLRLFNNHLTAVPHFGGKTLPQLKLLELNKNEITDVPLSFFKSLPAMTRCNLSTNKLETIPSGIDCPKLEWLLLANNNLVALPPDLPLLPSLRVLFLQGNQLNELPETFIRAKTLARVNLAKNNKLTQTSMHIMVSVKKQCDANRGQYWSPDTLG